MKFFFFFTLVTGPRRSLSLKLSDTRVYEPQIRARLVLCGGGGVGVQVAGRGFGFRFGVEGFEPSLDALSLRSDVIRSIKLIYL